MSGWVPHISILRCGPRAERDRLPSTNKKIVTSTEVTNSLIVCRVVERSPHFAFVVVCFPCDVICYAVLEIPKKGEATGVSVGQQEIQ